MQTRELRTTKGFNIQLERTEKITQVTSLKLMSVYSITLHSLSIIFCMYNIKISMKYKYNRVQLSEFDRCVRGKTVENMK